MPPTKQAAIRQSITLKGSTELVTEFFKYAVNTWVAFIINIHNRSLAEVKPLLCRVLFQRGVYPADDFHMVKKYGQTVLITQDLALENYLEKYSLLSPMLLGLFSRHSRILKQVSSKRMVGHRPDWDN
jgi:mitotic spindle assembly checkpoint protein MAD2